MQTHLETLAIIDDDEISLLLIGKIIERKQIVETILPFTNGFDAITYLKNNLSDTSRLPSIILLDISMPEMNGWQFIRAMNKIKFEVDYKPAICIISGGANIDFEMLKKFPSVKGYLVKPVFPDKLMEVIESVTQEYSLH